MFFFIIVVMYWFSLKYFIIMDCADCDVVLIIIVIGIET